MSMRQRADGSHDSREVETLPTPLWLCTSELFLGPAAVVTKKELRYKLSPFADWAAEPEVLPSSMQIEHVYRGPASSDWLVVSFMSKAVPGHNMLNWVETPIRMSGFPSIQIAAKADPVPDLVAWNYEGNSPAYMEKLGVEEMHGFTGLARFDQAVARLYVLMLCKTNLAWMFFLSLQSSAGNGNELATLRDDHQRAGSLFGRLRLDLAK
jgi:hypothetical protein